MPRIARVVVPGRPHHVTQRGNRGVAVFADDEDRRRYLSVLGKYSRRYELEVWAYCLMTNHMHLVVVPQTAEAMGKVLRDTQRTYATRFNAKSGERGHLWHSRYFSCVLDAAHFWTAVRYVERNPVRAGLVRRAVDYRWSSAAAHCGLRDDSLLCGDLELADDVGDWSAWLADEDELDVKRIREQTRTGRPCGAVSFVKRLETRLARPLRLRKRGRKSAEEKQK